MLLTRKTQAKEDRARMAAETKAKARETHAGKIGMWCDDLRQHLMGISLAEVLEEERKGEGRGGGAPCHAPSFFRGAWRARSSTVDMSWVYILSKKKSISE